MKFKTCIYSALFCVTETRTIHLTILSCIVPVAECSTLDNEIMLASLVSLSERELSAYRPLKFHVSINL
jgi:hypothetical protein